MPGPAAGSGEGAPRGREGDRLSGPAGGAVPGPGAGERRGAAASVLTAVEAARAAGRGNGAGAARLNFGDCCLAQAGRSGKPEMRLWEPG